MQQEPQRQSQMTPAEIKLRHKARMGIEQIVRECPQRGSMYGRGRGGEARRRRGRAGQREPAGLLFRP